MKLLFTLVSGLLLLGGCATVDEGEYRFSQGWRQARVERLVSANELDKPWFWKCTRGTSEAQRQGHEYVVLSYRAFGRRQYRLVERETQQTLSPQQPVYLRASACQNAVVVPQTTGIGSPRG